MDTKSTGCLERINPVSDRRGSIRSWRSFAYIKTDLHGLGGRLGNLEPDNNNPIEGLAAARLGADRSGRAARQPQHARRSQRFNADWLRKL